MAMPAPKPTVPPTATVPTMRVKLRDSFAWTLTLPPATTVAPAPMNADVPLGIWFASNEFFTASVGVALETELLAVPLPVATSCEPTSCPD